MRLSPSNSSLSAISKESPRHGVGAGKRESDPFRDLIRFKRFHHACRG
jgi:hypothetical protein